MLGLRRLRFTGGALGWYASTRCLAPSLPSSSAPVGYYERVSSALGIILWLGIMNDHANHSTTRPQPRRSQCTSTVCGRACGAFKRTSRVSVRLHTRRLHTRTTTHTCVLDYRRACRRTAWYSAGGLAARPLRRVHGRARGARQRTNGRSANPESANRAVCGADRVRHYLYRRYTACHCALSWPHTAHTRPAARGGPQPFEIRPIRPGGRFRVALSPGGVPRSPVGRGIVCRIWPLSYEVASV